MKEFVRDVRPKLLQHVKELVRRQLHTELPERGTTRPVLRWNIGVQDARRGGVAEKLGIVELLRTSVRAGDERCDLGAWLIRRMIG